MRLSHTQPIVVAFFVLAVVSTLFLLPSSASARDIKGQATDWVMSSHLTTGGPFGVVGVSALGKLTPWLALEAGFGHDTQRSDRTGSLRASSRVHVLTPEIGTNNRFSMGLFAGFGYDSLEAKEDTEGGFFFTSYTRSVVYEDLMTFNAGATLNLVTRDGFRLGLEGGVVENLFARRFEDLGGFDGESDPNPEVLPEGNIYLGANLGIVW